MKVKARLIFSILFSTALVVGVFSYFQVHQEEMRLNEELRLRTTVLSKTFKGAVEALLEQTENPERIKKFIQQYQGHKRLVGLVIEMKDGERIALPPELNSSILFYKEAREVIDRREALDVNREWAGRRVNFHCVPLEKNDEVVGALGIIHDRTFIVTQIRELWKNSAITFSILALILSGVTLGLIQISITRPLERISDMIRKTTAGESSSGKESSQGKNEIEKLMVSVSQMATHLKAARINLAAQSKLVNAEGTIWTKERLKDYLSTKLEGKSLFVIANREPYVHRKKGSEIECITPASGVVTALDPVMRATGGVWIAHGAGDADRETVGNKDCLQVPPWKPSYTLKRIWLTDDEEKGYYYGFSNEGLWPLCHISHVRPIFRMEDWKQYQRVNQKFADALLKELDDTPPFILIQDYHFALLPKMIKEVRPDAKIALFWHIPWPNPEAFGICPWQAEILEGMLGSDVIGFHTQFHCNNFLDTVDRGLESRIDWTTFTVTRGGKASSIRPFPISVDHLPLREPASWTQDESFKKLLKTYELENKKIGVGVDRIDYTKGLLERFRAVERTLEKYSDLRGKLVFVQLGAPSRTLIPGYRNHLEEVEALVQKINTRFQSGNYKPILFLKEHHGQDIIRNFYQIAHFCLVSSLHDGMNLVAKEFVTAREDEDGVLILSRFAGASHEFTSAVQINPYDIEGTADAISYSLKMHYGERKERMIKLREVVREYNVYRWAADLITTLVKSY